MKYLFLIVMGFFGIWIGRRLAILQKTRKMFAYNRATDVVEHRKHGAKDRIIKFLEEQSRITNDDVQTLLDISDVIATRYLQELEEEGAIVQRGKTNRGAYHELKK